MTSPEPGEIAPGAGAVVLLGPRCGLLDALARRLASEGFDATAVVADPARPGHDPAAAGVVASLGDRDLGDRDLAALVHLQGQATTGSGPTELLSAATWDGRCESVLREAIEVMQAAHDRLTPGGVHVSLLPTIALTGSATDAPWAAAAEGQRVLAKVAARQWADDGLRANVVAVEPDLLVEGSTGTSEAALDLVSLLLGVGARALSGATLVADDGGVMVP